MSSFEIRITNLSWKATESDIHDFVSTFAKVKEVKLILDFQKRSKGFAYLKLEDEQSQQEATKDVERIHMDRIVKITKAVPLSELPPREQRPRENKPRENQIREQKPREQNQFIGEKRENNQTRQEGKPRGRDQKATGSKRTNFEKAPRQRFNDDTSVYVGNLSWNTTELALGRHFESYGDIKNVKIIEDFDGRSKGFGYVEFEASKSVVNALQSNGSELDGRTLKVNVVKRDEKPRRTDNN